MNKEELKEKINKSSKVVGSLLVCYNNKEDEWKNDIIEIKKVNLFALIDQLDEPETLSEKWIFDNREMYLVNDTSEYAVNVWRLKNLIIPEPEKPVVPEFVADFIKNNKGRLNVYGGLDDVQNNQGSEMWEWVFYNHNQDEFAEAWLAYPNIEVGKEQKYHVNILDEGTGAYLIYYPKSGNYGVTGILDDNKGITRFTEQEIKDYDERFWPFAVKVEELEE